MVKKGDDALLVDLSKEDLDRYLEENYGFGSDDFFDAMEEVSTFYSLFRKLKSAETFLKHIDDLKGSTDKLIRMLYRHLKGWGLVPTLERDFLAKHLVTIDEFGVPKELPHKDNMPAIDKNEIIRDLFSLASYEKLVNREIAGRQRWWMLTQDQYAFPDKKKKIISPMTLLVLVWLPAMKERGATNELIFEDIHELLDWFHNSQNADVEKLFGKKFKTISARTIRQAYELYAIKKKSKVNSIYGELADNLYQNSFHYRVEE